MDSPTYAKTETNDTCRICNEPVEDNTGLECINNGNIVYYSDIHEKCYNILYIIKSCGLT
jgi:hypothetical protein